MFWDRMTPFYAHLPGVPGFGVATGIDQVGLLATAGVGAAFAAHGLVQLGRHKLGKKETEGEGEQP
jgi:hypothetical protein